MAAVTSAVVVAGATVYNGYQQREAAKDAARSQARGVEGAQQATIEATNRAREAMSGRSPIQQLVGSLPQIPGAQTPGVSAANRALGIAARAEPQLPGLPDPRQELLSGIEGQMSFTNQGFGQAQNTLSPLSQLAQPYIQEQYNLLGMGGQGAQQQALSRVSDPLVAEQERALLRNNAALGGVGGNVLSALAEQTRARTEANIGNRLAQLGSASSPALNALQQMSNLQLNQGLSMSDITGMGGRDLASQETARRQALANLELGQGSELAQLSQNLGTARAGGAAYAAQTQSPLTQGLLGGLSAYLGAGGTFGGGGGYSGTGGTTAMNVQNPNLYGNIA